MNTPPTTVALVTLGCARNDVDSEELAGRLEAGGFRLVDDAAEADTVVVNTCGFVEAAKKDSVDTLLAAADYKESGRTQAVVAVGCLAERYGDQLAEALPETDAVLSFDDYTDISDRLRSILAGNKHQPHVPRDRRKLLPLAPADRHSAPAPAVPGHGDQPTTAGQPTGGGQASGAEQPTSGGQPTSAGQAGGAGRLAGGELSAGDARVAGIGSHIPEQLRPTGAARSGEQTDGLKGRFVTGAPEELKIDAPDLATAPASGPRVVRRRLDGGPMAPLKLASGCDRRCAFCAIPMFRGAFMSRRPAEVLREAEWLAENGVRELFLVSENSTSYGKDLGDLRLLETLVGEIAQVPGIIRVRVSYLQPAEMRPTLISAMTSTPGVVPYFDLSFQHASGPLLRRMRRFGDSERFLELIAQVRATAPTAGIRSNVIVGFPGETEEDVDILCDFLSRAGLDAIGVFGYSDEDGTEAETYDGKLDEDTIAARLDRVTRLAEDLTSARAESRIGELLEVLIESTDSTNPGSYDAQSDEDDLDGAELDGVELDGADMGDADMGDADLGEAELDDAELDAAGPDRVGPDGAELDEVELGAAGRRVGLDGVLTAGAGRTGEGRAAHQGPEVDGSTTVTGLPDGVRVGDLVSAKVVASDGVDLIAEFAALVSTPDARPAANLTA
ncbi:MiaB/RimO family radical SAM methylthiotransferase [Kribbella pratensis]|uniref:Ribosomal protein uS12 methylthiotransferase RimO n=2 Tax=Kribbella pratensis TaxID=2512112 RepID=A0A4R8CJD0_9ACTN|nr:radical SAM protein [Kribbella pratensis]TDW75935.1 MiaB/RimO family radical SAM methylthiotransferase [Kribbella pratensis]